jgi:ADP-ribosylglycohydrolase
MLGAIAGDIIGSVYERYPIKTTDFPLFHDACRFTDDSVMTLAVARAILTQQNYGTAMQTLGRQYPQAGYGSAFRNWLFEPVITPYGSFGNGSAMRVSPVGFAFDCRDDVLREARASAEVSHSHAEGIKGAQATALAVFLARTGAGKEDIRQEIMARFGYDLNRTVAAIRPEYHFDITCQGTVPEAIIAFLDSTDYEDAVRNAISLGGDSDTLACITGGIAHAFYQSIPAPIATEVRRRLTPELAGIVVDFMTKFHIPGLPEFLASGPSVSIK